jgi:thiamine-phosphate pyrophosphorylase
MKYKFKTQRSKFKTKIQNSKILRIIDVNTNRAVEGLRVMEDVARFVLEDKELTLEIKLLRGKARKIIGELIENENRFQQRLLQRKALKDIGRNLYTSSEAKRESLLDIFSANAKRVQEALRVLEEFSKLTSPAAGKSIKDIRFNVYELEKEISLLLNRYLLLDFDLYVVTDPMRDHVEVAREVVAAGGKIVQLRDKSASKKQILKWAREIRKLTKKANATFIVNDYVDIAKTVGADGVHLGQEDLNKLSLKTYRKRLGEDKIIGVSTHSYSQALKAAREGADYISVGPIFKTPSKPLGKAVGLKLLRKVLKKIKIPVVAIGGIDDSNIYNVRKTGCQRIAVIRAVLAKKDLKKAILRLQGAMGKRY